MGRRAIVKHRKEPTTKINEWLKLLLIKLQTVDLANLTIDELAELSGKSKATIYKYFASKEEVILAAVQTRIDTVTPIIQSILHDTALPVEERYRKLIEKFAIRLSDIRISFFHIVQQDYPVAWDAINEVSDLFLEALEELYLQGMDIGLFRPINIELLKTLDSFFVTQVITNPAIVENPNYTLNALIKDYLQLRLDGLNK